MTSRSGATHPQTEGLAVRGLIARRLREARTARHLSVKQLAARCTELGAEDVAYNVISNIELGRRDVSAHHLLVLALALDVPPLQLITLAADGSESLALTSTVAVHDPVLLERWLHGQQALPEGDEAAFASAAKHSSAPPSAQLSQLYFQEQFASLESQFKAESAALLGRAREQMTQLVETLRESVASGTPTADLLAELDDVAKQLNPHKS